MLRKEQNYEFRKRIDNVHPLRFDISGASAKSGETAVTEEWEIVYPAGCSGDAVELTAYDISDYFRTVMGLNIRVCRGKNPGRKTIALDPSASGMARGEYELSVEEESITISASCASGIRRGGVYLEDTLNLREAPFLKTGVERRKKLITPRIVHSGWGIELFPDSHLNAIMHAGFDAIAVFCTGMNRTNVGTLDFNDLITRAAKYDIDFYFYAYLPSFKHPDDDDAEEFFENIYTRLFERYPGAAGLMLVGESAEFPSKDPATTGKKCRESLVDGIAEVKPSPGWWPCNDYPRWLKRVRDAVYKAKPGARIIFNTYNWGWTDLELRREFLKNIPEGITVQVTFDIFSKCSLYGMMSRVMDYSIVAVKPGYYFDSECHAAAEFNRPLLSTANTAGATWDFGDIPYVPVPQRWIARFKELDRFRRECNLSAFYDCHHYGWWPSVITELGKYYFSSPQADLDEMLNVLAGRMAGDGAELLVKAWSKWSEAFDYLPATNEDQYGPSRVGPSYPLIFQPNITRTMARKEIAFPTDPNAHFGNRIIFTLYQPYENINQLPATLRYPVELKALKHFLELWDEGIELYAQAIAAAPEAKREALERELNIGKFIRHAAQTTHNTKLWWCLNRDLQNVKTAAEGLELLDKIEALAYEEIENARTAIPLVEADSRLGWEPSMEYVCDRWHLEWKIRQVNSALLEIADYRKILNLPYGGE